MISNFGFYNENLSLLLDYHLQPFAQKIKSFIKDTNNILNNKIRKIGKLPEVNIICTVNAVCLYRSMPSGEGLAISKSFQKLSITIKSPVILLQN